MDELFSTLVYLIPLAFFIFIRLQAARRNQAKGSPGKGGAKTRPKGKLIEAGKPEQPLPRKVRSRDPGGSPAPVREVEPSPFVNRILAALIPPEERRILRPVPRETGVSGPSLPSYGERPSPAEGEPLKTVSPISAPPVPPMAAKPQAEERRGLSFANVDRLSPLRKAVVMMEILGKPKGL